MRLATNLTAVAVQPWCAPSAAATPSSRCGGIASATHLFCQPDAGYTFTYYELAHYTVKEYLFSDRIGCGPAAFFAMSTEFSVVEQLESLLPYAARLNLHTQPKPWYVSFDNYCREVSRLAPMRFESQITNNENLWPLLLG